MGSEIPQDFPGSFSSTSETEKLDCPVCYTCLLPPIFQCKNGHLLCKVCIKKLKVCPVCRTSLPKDKIRSLIAEKLAATISTRCVNSDLGCQVVLKGLELKTHMEICLFRLVRMCQYFGFHECSEEVPLRGIVSHLKSAHSVREVNIKNGEYIELLQKGIREAELDRCGTAWLPVIFKYDDYPPLVLKTTLTMDSVSWTISAVHSDEQVEGLTAKIKLVFDKQERTSVTWKGTLSKVKTSIPDRNSSFSVPITMIRVLDHWKLLIKISVGQQRKPAREVVQLTLEPRPVPTFIPNSGTGETRHPGVSCNGCDLDVKRLRFKCSICPDFDLCQACYVERKIHIEKAHVFLVLPSPDASAALAGADNFNEWRRERGIFQEVDCDGCTRRIQGLWFMCTECLDYDLCQQCYLGRKLHRHHFFVTAQSPVVDNLSRNSAFWLGMKLSSAVRLCRRLENFSSSSDSDL